MKQDESFGVIPLRQKERGWEVFLIQHVQSKDWGFPKGHAKKEETPMDAAARELYEETGLSVVTWIETNPLFEVYRFFRGQEEISKRVAYFLAHVEGEVQLQSKEIQAGGWFSFDEAFGTLTHAGGRLLLRSAMEHCT